MKPTITILEGISNKREDLRFKNLIAHIAAHTDQDNSQLNQEDERHLIAWLSAIQIDEKSPAELANLVHNEITSWIREASKPNQQQRSRAA